MCAVWGAHLFFQKRNLAWEVGFPAAGSGSDESIFRISPIWWLHSITADSREWRTPATTSPLWSFHTQPFRKQRAALDSELLPSILHVCSTFCPAPARLAPPPPSPQGEAAESCLGLGLISRKYWSGGPERGAWCPETRPVAIHCGSSCCTAEEPQPGGGRGQGPNDHCGLKRLPFNFHLNVNVLGYIYFNPW